MHRYPAKLNDEDLALFNASLPWHAGTALPDGRILGSLNARAGKRSEVQPIPDKRITRLHQALDLQGKSVLEVGCFEGIHTLGLCGFGARVTAVDLRPINVLKTHARLSAYGVSADVFTVDVEDDTIDLPKFDVIFHCGVLYHLEEPVRHLRRLLPRCNAIYLDTHVAGDDDTAVLHSGGETFHGKAFVEGGWADPFSGRGQGAFWLKLHDLVGIFEAEGFLVEHWGLRQERNGPRVGLLATRRDP